MIPALLNAFAQDTSTVAEIEVELTSGEVFEVLGNQRRRETIRYLETVSDNADGLSVSVEDIAEHVAASEYAVPADELDHDQEWGVHAALAQTHLPALEEAGLVTVVDGRVRPAAISDIAELLAIVDEACDNQDREA